MKTSEFRKLIREEIKLILLEKQDWSSYLKLLGYNAKKFKNLDPNKYNYYMKAYKKSSDASEFEQNNLDDLERDINKIKI
ncbi:MAG: hypothetical protein H8E98_03420 [Bacteroidetes bacterium]|nr:hypothetical protein [Bacteroidota bacterium]